MRFVFLPEKQSTLLGSYGGFSISDHDEQATVGSVHQSAGTSEARPHASSEFNKELVYSSDDDELGNIFLTNPSDGNGRKHWRVSETRSFGTWTRGYARRTATARPRSGGRHTAVTRSGGYRCPACPPAASVKPRGGSSSTSATPPTRSSRPPWPSTATPLPKWTSPTRTTTRCRRCATRHTRYFLLILACVF